MAKIPYRNMYSQLRMKGYTTIAQIPLPFIEHIENQNPLQQDIRRMYTIDSITSCDARVALELGYASLLMPTHQFNRKLVSYQANKQAKLHSWFKYKEGFSAQLVEKLIHEFEIGPQQKILDPFAGSATTLLVAQAHGINATGIELLAPCHLAWEVKSRYYQYDLVMLREIQDWTIKTEPGLSPKSFPHVTITHSAFSHEQAAKLMWYKEQFELLTVDKPTKQLLLLVLMSVLEDISFTRKDGQYLRWDSRSEKAKVRDARRVQQGKPAYKIFHKSKILNITEAILTALEQVIRDVELLQRFRPLPSQQEMFKQSALDVLPKLADGQFDGVITSPPYCNRYDYTRTYALELAFLGIDEKKLVSLRQEQLSCTVENRSKLEYLTTFYANINRTHDFEKITQTIDTNPVFQEIMNALEIRNNRGDLNNKGVVQMVRGYFTELAFVIFELFRVCQNGAQVAIVNDNVRYGGEIIPVDLLMTDIAAGFGFQPQMIHVLQQGKGNSSQQMGKYGREALRKSVIIWKKPAIAQES